MISAMAASIDETALVEAAIAAVTQAYEDASAAIEGLANADEAFDYATKLWAALREATDANGGLRAALTERIWQAHELDLTELAARLSRPGHPVGRSRAHQLLQAARAATFPKEGAA